MSARTLSNPIPFESSVREAFSFLEDRGFVRVETLSTLVRYCRGQVEVDVYLGRQSGEIGANVSAFGTRYSISEILRTVDSTRGAAYKNKTAANETDLLAALAELRLIFEEYAEPALTGDETFFAALEKQRALWSKQFALEVLADQLRPQADAAFRSQDYAMAAKLYSQIESLLTPTERKKFVIAQQRSGSQPR